jgi:hypothetical protein
LEITASEWSLAALTDQRESEAQHRRVLSRRAARWHVRNNTAARETSAYCWGVPTKTRGFRPAVKEQGSCAMSHADFVRGSHQAEIDPIALILKSAFAGGLGFAIVLMAWVAWLLQ